MTVVSSFRLNFRGQSAAGTTRLLSVNRQDNIGCAYLMSGNQGDIGRVLSWGYSPSMRIQNTLLLTQLTSGNVCSVSEG